MDAKKRSTNFTSEEVITLVNIVNKHKHIIENKQTNAVYNKKKNEEWEKISQEFNSLGNSFRCAQTLKTKYENIKKTSKKNFAAERQIIYATGGGTEDSPVTSLDERVRAMMQAPATGFKSVVDLDTVVVDPLDFIMSEEISKSPTFESQLLNQNSQKSLIESECSMRSGNQNTFFTENVCPKLEHPSTSKKRKLNHHQNQKANGRSEKWEELANEKQNATKEKRSQQKQQHELTLKHMAEEHKLKIEVLELQKKKLWLEIETIKMHK